MKMLQYTVKRFVIMLFTLFIIATATFFLLAATPGDALSARVEKLPDSVAQRMYAKYGRTSLAVKFAPGELDGKGTGNSFYNDLVANSNTDVADAICDIIYGRDQDLISPIQTARLLNTYSARLAKFVNDLQRNGYDVCVGDGLDQGNGKLDNNTIIVNWA